MDDRRPLTQPDTSRAGALGWVDDVERATLDNDTFRTVLFTGQHLQLTVMRLAPGEDVGLEVHPQHDQFVRLEAGTARLDLGLDRDEVAESRKLGPDWACIIPAGVWHNIVNVGADDVKLYSLYAPPEHPPGTVHRTRRDSDAAHDH
jgi:mannose-6-phosphate isomerase-like protein (cupin superfamily)